MEVIYEEDVPDLPGHKLQVGRSSWQNGRDLSVRFFVPQEGSTRFDRYNSPETPANLLPRLLELAIRHGDTSMQSSGDGLS